MAYATKSQAGSSGPKKPSNAGKFVLPKADNAKGHGPKYIGQTQKFEDGWPKYMDHDPRLIASVWKEGANHPYQVRTADGTYSVPKGMGGKSKLTKDKSSARTYVERERPNVAGFGKGSHKEKSGGN